MISLELLAYALNNICKFETLKIAFARRTHTLNPQPQPPPHVRLPLRGDQLKEITRLLRFGIDGDWVVLRLIHLTNSASLVFSVPFVVQRMK